jgi:3-hydroxyacyl-[acyl-carrier-protein] dehydratase
MTTTRGLDWKWLDRISHVDPSGTTLLAHRRVCASEWYFRHHFEHFPVVPGVLLLEMMVHAAGFLQCLRVREKTSTWSHFFLVGANNTRFYRHAPPDSELELTASWAQGDDDQSLLRAEARMNGARVARSEVLVHRVEADWTLAQDAVLAHRLHELLPEDLRVRYKVEV